MTAVTVVFVQITIPLFIIVDIICYQTIHMASIHSHHGAGATLFVLLCDVLVAAEILMFPIAHHSLVVVVLVMATIILEEGDNVKHRPRYHLVINIFQLLLHVRPVII